VAPPEAHCLRFTVLEEALGLVLSTDEEGIDRGNPLERGTCAAITLRSESLKALRT